MTSGRCRAVVVGTGASTAIGKIRDAMVASQVSCEELGRQVQLCSFTLQTLEILPQGRQITGFYKRFLKGRSGSALTQ